MRDFPGVRISIGENASPGWSDFDAGLRDTPPDFEPGPTLAGDPGVLFFTSGTTGHAKMVLHTQASYGLGHAVTGKLWLDLRPATSAGRWPTPAGRRRRGRASSARGTPARACSWSTAAASLTRRPRWTCWSVTRSNVWCAPPTALRLIVREDLSARRFPRLRHCVSAGEPLNPEVIETWRRAIGLTIHEGYGQTESVVMVAHLRGTGGPVLPGSMGRPVPGFDLAVLDADLNEQPPGVEGELAMQFWC